MIIAIGSDHGGYRLKELIKEHLSSRGFEVLDLGTDSEDSVDYPVYGKACGEAVMSGKADRGVLCCGTGIGISIAANKIKGIRCAVCANVEMAALAKRHNDANIIALGGRILGDEQAVEIVNTWLDEVFEGGRHGLRVELLNSM